MSRWDWKYLCCVGYAVRTEIRQVIDKHVMVSGIIEFIEVVK